MKERCCYFLVSLKNALDLSASVTILWNYHSNHFPGC
jgi:hypothetical protein